MRVWLLGQNAKVLIDVGSEGLLVFLCKILEVCSILQELYDSLFDVCKSKEFFHTHADLATGFF